MQEEKDQQHGSSEHLAKWYPMLGTERRMRKDTPPPLRRARHIRVAAGSRRVRARPHVLLSSDIAAAVMVRPVYHFPPAA